jgi:hypothetical protein
MIRRAAGLLVLVLGFLLIAGPAYAHGGPIKLEVSGDGGQGVNATVTYQNDGHSVTDEVVLTYTAVAADGKTVGPVKMTASAEGQSFYTSAQPLPLGSWTVTVTAARPSAAQKTISVTSAALPAKPVELPKASSLNFVLFSVVLLAVLAGAAVIVLRRRKVRQAG